MRTRTVISGIVVLYALLVFSLAESAMADRPDLTVTIDEQHRLRVDGKPFFPIGLYSVPLDKLSHAKALGFNMVHTYGGEGNNRHDDAASAEEMKAYLDAAHALGLKVWMGLPRYQVRKQQFERLEPRIKLLQTSPALLVWYLFDEPNVSAELIASTAALIKKHDAATRPTVLCLDGVQKNRQHRKSITGYLDSADIIMTDPYPVRLVDSPLGLVYDEITLTRELLGDKKPVWNVLQFQGKGNGGEGYGLLEPNFEQLRNMTYQSVVAGARGLTGFAYDARQFDLFKSEQGMQNVKAITTELRALSPILLSQTPKESPLSVEAHDAIRTRVFIHKETHYLFVVNVMYASATLKAEPLRGQLPAVIKLLSHERMLKTIDNRLIEDIEPLGVRVYQIDVK